MSDTTNSKTQQVDVDVLIIGGGVAGLWSLARLRDAGYKAVLLESRALGSGQTRFAQGIIHGGTKYALTGKLTASSEAVADMPARWRACYEGHGELDLSKAELLSDAHYLWSTTSLTSRISGFFASKVMRARSKELDKSDLPSIFQNDQFKGQIYRLDEPVFNTLSVIRALAEPVKESILIVDYETLVPAEKQLTVDSADGGSYTFHYQKLILMAGQGNEDLLSHFGYGEPVMQRRPLKMAVMCKPGDPDFNDMVYAHCLGASVNPRITITSHRDNRGHIIWYMGGQLAEDGVSMTDADFIARTIDELQELIPWLDLEGADLGVLNIDRAEIKKPGTSRPDSFSVETHEDVITAWPTKMALSPALADAIIAELELTAPAGHGDEPLPEWCDPVYAEFPWDDGDCWQCTHRVQV